MKELLKKLLDYFEKFQVNDCNCKVCIEARAWIAMIEKEFEDDTNPKN